MYLKSIEVQGFKSFANKIVFEFHNGITGIVGPNGSGKSNVGDAVRWVLGEQSARQLRGASMQDVIFSGTENRKPLAYAFVAITLDNSDHKLAVDYEEVTVARKVYRSGESEYLLNGSVCRLKDVQELFYDTGIGKEGYSLIGQGQIDRILSGKPEERRELFDEAAGIVKFKKRKKAAQKNLENERANLVRINDILSELEKQVGPLEEQAEKAKIYLNKREELKSLDVNLFLIEIKEIKEQLRSVEEKIRILNEDYEETDAHYETTKAEYEKVLARTSQVEERIEEARNALSQASVLSQRLEGEINVLKEQIHSSEDAVNRIEERKKVVQSELLERQTSLEGLDGEWNELTKRLSSMMEKSSDARGLLAQVQARLADYNTRIEKAKNDIIQLLNDKASTQGKQQRYDTMLEQVQIRKAELNQRLLTMKTNESEQQVFIDQYEQELLQISEKLEQWMHSEREFKQKRQELEQNQTQRTDYLRKLQNSFHKEQSRLDTLVNITERYDGYSNAIRRVMEQKNHNSGLLGVVADLIKTEKKYEMAIETALGGSIQNIVTEDEQTAKVMIEYLKKNHLGRATFLPLDSINGRGGIGREEALRENGALGVADTLVQAEKQYKVLLNYLLGKTLVVDTMDHAILIARKYKHSIRIVTLEGELLNPGGSMTGGAFKNNSNLLGRRREIEELEEKTKELNIQIKNVESQLSDGQREIMRLKEEQQKLSGQMQDAYLKQNTARMNYNQAIERRNEVMSGYESLQSEGDEMEQQMQSIGYQKKQIHEEVERIQNKVEELNTFIDEWQMCVLEEQKTEAKVSEQVSGQQIDEAGLKQKQDNIRENKQRVEEEIARRKEELLKLEEEYRQIVQAFGEKEEQILTMQGAFSEAEEEKHIKKELLELLGKEKDALAENNKEFLDKRESLLQRKNDLDKERTRLDAQREKLEESHEASMNYMWEEYELTYNAAVPLRNEKYADSVQLRNLVRGVRDEIRKLGTVNVNSIEDYKNVSERYEFLNGQRNDLLEAEQTLMNIIQELDEGMRRQFTEKFEEIRQEFDKVFKELFGGGKGTLELDEDVDILEAGIRINSQPPGKKLGNMMQLSGGEKALTAIALLFAIQNLKPSPFCLLDEIEAALDDSNVNRYARYLHKLTKHTQFIIITHRRGTMAAADRLYGITMQEKGVSTLVSVDLIEDDLDK